MDRSRKTARTANQPSQGVPQFGIVDFDRISVAFVGVSAPLAGEIDERFVGRESIGIMLFCLGRTVEHGLPGGVVTGKNDIPTDDTAAVTVYVGDDVCFIFLAPMYVNSSSNSLTVNG